MRIPQKIINFKILNENAKIPTRANPTDAGADLYSVEESYVLPQQRKLIKTGISLEIPVNYYGRIAPRSGLALKNGIDVLAGVIDSSYRGELGVVLYNSDKENTFQVKQGDRIAQIIIEAHYNFEFIEVKELNDTDRGIGGFGSTGSK